MGLAGLMAMDDEDEEISVVARGRNVDQGTRGRIMRGVRGFLWFLFSVWTENADQHYEGREVRHFVGFSAVAIGTLLSWGVWLLVVIMSSNVQGKVRERK
jgi:hypothetical protein